MREPRSFYQSISQAEGAAVDLAVRRALAGSLSTVYARPPVFVEYDKDRLDSLLHEINCGPVRPAVFGLYTDLVESLLSNDRRGFEALSQTLLGLDVARNGTHIVSLRDEDIGTGQAERYVRLIDDDPDRRYAIEPLCSRYQHAFSRVLSAMTLLDEGAPELALEIRALVREVVLVTDRGGIAERSFDGASTFYLWGAVFLNVSDATRLDLAQQIAHEAGHLLLFGLMMGQPLTENDLSERYASPLREDPRPMEGLVHAAFVLARMSYVLRRFLRSGVLSLEEAERARQDLATHHDRFFDSLPVIMSYARFRPGGDAIFHGAVEYMSEEDQQKRMIA